MYCILGSANELTSSNVEFEDYARHDSTVELLLRLQRAEEKERAAEAQLRWMTKRLETTYRISQAFDDELSEENANFVLQAFAETRESKDAWLWVAPLAHQPTYRWEAQPSTEAPFPLALLHEIAAAKVERVVSNYIFVPLVLSAGDVSLLAFDRGRTTEMDEEGYKIFARALIRQLNRSHFHRDLVRARNEAEEAARIKSTFLATMSHEVRTPLNAVIGLMDLLMEGKLSAEQREYVMLAQASGKDLLRIVSDILDFSKVEAGQLELEFIEFDLYALINRMVRQVRAIVAQKKIEIKVEYSNDVSRWCKGDPIRVGKILNNLLSNAVKFTEEGIISLRLFRRGDILRMEVEDRGVGIESTKLQRLFQPFRQADESTTRRYGGTGLGLAIAKALVDQMKGEIGVHSESGQGSTFWFSISLPPCEESDDAPESVRTSLELVAPKGRTFARPVLVAEDNPVNRRLMRGFLQHLAFQVVEVESGDGAIEEYKKGTEFAAILMDWQMPGCDGIAATERIRAIERAENRRHVPIICLSANALAGDREQCLSAGMDEYMTKPIRFDSLRATLGRWVHSDEGESSSLDLEALNETLGTGQGESDLAREVIGIFLEDSELRIEAMRRAVHQNEMLELAKQAHTLKGSSGNIAAPTLARLSADLEKLARSGDGLGATRLFGQVYKEHESVRRACLKFLELGNASQAKV